MPTPSRPRRGSKGFGPRKRAKSEVPTFRSWPEADGEPVLQGFAGYKAGMTHVLMVNDHSGSPKEGITESVPVTILETPPMRVAAVRAYRDTPYGKRPLTEVWTDDLSPDLERSLAVPEGHDPDGAEEKIRESLDEVSEIRAITYTLPGSVKGIPKKTPDIMETKVGGAGTEAQLDFALGLLEGEVKADDVHRAGEYIDVSGVTKGKGTQGPVKRWGVQLRKGKHARQGWRRRIGNLGPWHPSRVRSTVPQQGQTGYHQRTEVNKRILSIGDDGDDATPDGGFVNYGEVDSPYMLVKGSIPGPKKRLVRTRHAIRPKEDPRYDPEIRYVSKESNQG
ncbi:MAG: 50S ribosomal protein L3 [Halobacteria archaeon]|nr:50S ribosomal protein L3 [Halobacteria archaeon]